MTPFTRHFATAAACAALALPVMAQTSATSPAASPTAPVAAQPGNAGPSGTRNAKRHQRQENRAERHAAHLAEMKKTLAITPAQEPAWASFAQAMQPRSDATRPDRMAMEKLTTPERIEHMRTLRAERNAAMDARMDATKAFYAQLDATQQQSFDHASARMMHMGDQRRGHMRGGKGEGKQGRHREQGGSAPRS